MTMLFKLAPWFLIIALIAAVLWFWKDKEAVKVDLATTQGQLQVAQGTIATDKAVHEADQASIKQITQYREDSDKVMARFYADFKGIEGHFLDFSNQLNKLRQTDVEVSKYLAQPIPIGLRNLLNGVPNNAKAAPSRTPNNR